MVHVGPMVHVGLMVDFGPMVHVGLIRHVGPIRCVVPMEHFVLRGLHSRPGFALCSMAKHFHSVSLHPGVYWLRALNSPQVLYINDVLLILIRSFQPI